MDTNFSGDIPLSLAQAAHDGTSFVPERRASQEVEGYAGTLAHDFADLLKHATTDEKRATLEAEFARYREGYKRRTVAYLGARSRCVSSMIAGPSNFPARRMERRSNVADKRMGELVEYRERALKAIRRALHPELAPIMLGDSDADTRLRSKLEAAEKLQAGMKAANAAIRRHAKAGADAQVAALLALGFAEIAARKLLVPDFCGRIGFADFETKNNGAEIRRIKARIGAVERIATAEPTITTGDAARVEDVPAENRVRLFFPGKPSADVRGRLKRGGFRWTPSVGCWQAYRHTHTIALAQEIAGVRTAA